MEIIGDMISSDVGNEAAKPMAVVAWMQLRIASMNLARRGTYSCTPIFVVLSEHSAKLFCAGCGLFAVGSAYVDNASRWPSVASCFLMPSARTPAP